MAIPRTEVRDHHAGPQLEGRNDGVRIAQPILPGASGVQPPANRSGQAIEDHAFDIMATTVRQNHGH